MRLNLNAKFDFNIIQLALRRIDFVIVIAKMFDGTLGTFGKVPSTNFLPMTKESDMEIVENMGIGRQHI